MAVRRRFLVALPVAFALAIVLALIVASKFLIPSPSASVEEDAPEVHSPPEDLSARYAFPSAIDPSVASSDQHYLFYVHGRIIEDQGLPAISEIYGEYQYGAILEALSKEGFLVFAEQRSANADATEYGNRFAAQVEELLAAGVPGSNITVVGGSKGAFIASWVSHQVEHPEVRYVLLAGCHPNTVQFMLESEVVLHGRVLAMRDFKDTESAGSCAKIFALSAGYGSLMESDEVVLEVGSSHGLIYQPLEEWVKPTVEWARRPILDTPSP